VAGLIIEKIAKISHVGTLFSMYVKDELRGDGIGFALVNFVKDYANKIMSSICILVVMPKIMVRLNYIKNVGLKFTELDQITPRLAINFMMI